VISPRRRVVPSVADLHRHWLELVDTDGPFLAVSPLKRVWPQGMPALPEARRDALSYARKDFESAWEALERSAGDDAAVEAYRVARDKWVETVLRDVAGWAESLAWGQVPGVQAQSPNHAVTVTAQAALSGTDGVGALVHLIDPVESLRQTPNDLWAATPIDRMEALLRDNGCEVGIVTDGRWWGLVCAREGSMAASGVVDSLTWIEEPRTRDAFLTVIGRQYIVGGDSVERLPVLFAESVAAAEEITEALGAQVRRAVELLVQSFSESAADATRRGAPDPLPENTHQVYEAAVTVMMRIVFLLFAEERGLLPSGELFAQGYGISEELDRLQAREVEDGEEALDATSLTWHRLLATSQALYRGASFESMRMPAYGGSLFDPSRFSFLTAAGEHGTLSLTVSDRVMLHVLRSVQQAVLKGVETRRISFRDVDVEQIGYIYEGLLGYTAVTVGETYLGLRGATGEEPEIPLVVLEQMGTANADAKKFGAAIQGWVEQDQPSAKPQSIAAIAKAAGAAIDPNVASGLMQAVGGERGLHERVLPWLGLVRLDLRGRPFVVLDGGLMVKETPSRKNAGAHYTPKSLAEEVVLHALQPLCYLPGPHQMPEEAEWRLKSSDDILSLKVADIACGSGAFLVAAARYLADRVVEAWNTEDASNSRRGDLRLRAIREVVANCLYGADINDMAVEMCKLSLWLVSLDRDLPFSFVDDKIFHGNSLLGLTSLDQLRKLNIDPTRVPAGEMFDIFDVDIDAIILKAILLRERLATPIDDDDPARNSAAKLRQFNELHRVTADLRTIADGVVAAGLPLGGRPSKAFDDAYENLRVAVKAAHPEIGRPDPTLLDAIIDTGLKPIVPTDYRRWKPLHWIIEAPDVIAERGGFDAIIGNPPFLAGKKIAIATGSNIESWTKRDLNGQRGAADLIAHFIRRAWRLLVESGCLGVIATDRVGQGDTAAMSTEVLANEGRIYRATSAFRWPGKASTGAAIVWAVKAKAHNSMLFAELDGLAVRSIAPSLVDGGEADLSTAITLTLPFLAGKAVQVYGEGFILDTNDPLLSQLNPNEAAALRSFVNGQSLMSGVPSGRVAIDVNGYFDEDILFADMPILAGHLERTVKPLRDAITSQVHEARYWAHWDKRTKLMQTAHSLDRFIVLARDTRVPIFLFTSDHDALFSDKVVVIASNSPGVLGVLSSTVHAAWFERTRTGRGTTSCYVVTRCLRTFPFPAVHDEDLIKASLEFVQARDVALNEVKSPSKLYNLMDDPTVNTSNIAEMRDKQILLDRAVLQGYGWSTDLIEHGFFELAGVRRFTCNPLQRVELRRKLLDENSALASSEKRLDPKNMKAGSRPQLGSDTEGTLFE
jgi:hypothetical protein